MIRKIDGGDVCILVDLGYRLCSQKRVPLQGSHGVTDTLVLSCSCSYYMLPTTLWKDLLQC